MMADAPATTRIDSLSEFEAQPDGEYSRWQAEIQAGEKELEKWKKSSRRIVKEFRASRSENNYVDPTMERRFNLFSANVQILQTALLNQLPKPTVGREFGDQMDDVARVAGWIMERALERQVTKNQRCYDILGQVVQDNLVPGVGLSWHTYSAEIETHEEEPTEEELMLNPEAEAREVEEVVDERIVDEYVYWEDIVWSPARTWEEVRWVARKVYMTRDKLVKRFGEDKGKKVSLDYSPKKTESSVETKNQLFQQAVVYEIWNKESKEVIWFAKGLESLLDKKEDFLELDDFYPFPKPLFATVSNGQMIPIPDYTFAADQYRELNEINTRIGLLVKACRVAGVYDKTAPQVPGLLSNLAENILVPVDQWAAFAEKGGMKGAIDWLPLDQIVKTIDQLLKSREDVKAQIYEVTGMSDIIRGASKASETLGAQKIKAQYASMRIQKRQKDVAVYVSGVFNIQSQLMRKHMAPEEIARMAQVEQMGEDPQLIQQAIQLLSTPEFELRCQVESDTLSDIDFQAEKQDRMEYMQTVTNFLKETGGMLTQDQVLGPFVAQLLQFSLAGFKVGKKFEGQLDRTIQSLQKKLATPQPPKPTPEEQKAQAEIRIMEKESQLNQQGRQQELQFDNQRNQMKLQSEAQGQQLKQRGQQMEFAAKQQNHQQTMIQNAQKAQQQAMIQAQQAGPGKPPVQ